MQGKIVVNTLFDEKKKVCDLTTGDMVQVDEQLYTTIKEIKTVTVDSPIVTVVNGMSLYNTEWTSSNNIECGQFCDKLFGKHIFYNFVLTSGNQLLINDVYIKTL